jgi:Ser/Thr protein kinase RdoA (MazF antagonist)
LAYVAELGMVLQRAAPGRALTGVRHPDELYAAMQLAAKNLAALHDLPCAAGDVKTLQDHLVKYCHPGPEILMEALPMLAPMVRDLIDGIYAELNGLALALCPVHGDLNLAQVFIARDRALFIDFDGFCRSHAALDVGNFLITLAEHFSEGSGELRHGFLEAYLAAHAEHKLHGLRAYQAFAYLRRAMISFRMQDPAVRDQRVRKMLREGLACLLAND